MEAKQLEDEDLGRSGQQTITPVALTILENFLKQYGQELPNHVAKSPNNPLQYPRLEEKLCTYRRLLVYKDSKETDEMSCRAIAHHPVKTWEIGLGDLYKRLGSPEEIARVLSLIAEYRSDKGY